jgi:5-methylcytosine-specific restriction endonuclease McrA
MTASPAQELNVTSASAARALGLSRYFTAKPCANGHVAPRTTANRRCVKCRVVQVRRWRQRHPDLWNATRKRWRDKYPEKAKALRQNAAASHLLSTRGHRARKKNAQGSHTLADIEAIRVKQDGRCAACMALVKLTVDHIIPLKRGGSNSADNLQLLCHPCNSSKGSKIMHEWRALTSPKSREDGR